jgi:hypothetical protein
MLDCLPGWLVCIWFSVLRFCVYLSAPPLPSHLLSQTYSYKYKHVYNFVVKVIFPLVCLPSCNCLVDQFTKDFVIQGDANGAETLDIYEDDIAVRQKINHSVSVS